MKQSHFQHVEMANLLSGLEIELTNGINIFFACWYNFIEIKLKVLGVCMVKNWCGQSCDGTLKLTVFEEWTDGVNWFFVMQIHKN